ncbi:MAG: hypothetical protein WKF85_06600 [Chitinophagaceae bacterium]
MKKVTTQQLSKIHVLLSQLHLIDQKQHIISSFTNGRETSSKEMTLNEATQLIKHLAASDPCEKMRKKVFALAYNAGIIWGDTWEDKKMNAAKLNQFLLYRGAIKKELSRMNKNELVKVVTQFEYIIQHKGQTEANKATKFLLKELSIPVENSKEARH